MLEVLRNIIGSQDLN